MSETLTCATYNILHGYHRSQVLNNLRLLTGRGADVICMQEAEVEFVAALQQFMVRELPGWQVDAAHVGLGGNVALMWNAERLSLLRTELIRLPQLIGSRLAGSRIRFLKDVGADRAALVGYFELEGRTVQVANAHVAWEGGRAHRLRQIHYLRAALERESADVRIVAGDFNTLAFTREGRKTHEKQVENALGAAYVNALPGLAWTHDTSQADPSDGLGFLHILHRFGITFRTRLDYIFGAGVAVESSEMLDWPGSDHRPLIATFSIATTRQHTVIH